MLDDASHRIYRPDFIRGRNTALIRTILNVRRKAPALRHDGHSFHVAPVKVGYLVPVAAASHSWNTVALTFVNPAALNAPESVSGV